jgi:hypothetical protein
MEKGDVPRDGRGTNVTPKYRKGSKANSSNYRPVSLTSVSCKEMESIFRDTITDYLERNNLIGSNQHGFMRGKFCTTNLLEFLGKVTTAVERGEAFDIIYLDFDTAFVKVLCMNGSSGS